MAKSDSERFSELKAAALLVLREALDNVDVHPCDEDNDKIKARGLSTEMRKLYDAVHEE